MARSPGDNAPRRRRLGAGRSRDNEQLRRPPLDEWELGLRRHIPSGIVHINDQTVADEPIIPFGGAGASGNGPRIGGDANLDAFTETQWLTIAGEVPAYPF